MKCASESIKMKDVGLDWIGEIPESWQIKRGKTILTLLERPIKEDDNVITCFRDGEVTLRKNRREEGFTIALNEIGYQGIEPGDLVVHGMDGFAGAIGISDSRGKATPVLNVLESTENKRYLMYYLRMLAHRDVFLSLSTGIRVRSCDLRWNKLAVLPFVVPERSEQDAIVYYLDEQCEKIDHLIAETRESINEYKKWKESIIDAVTTKGLREKTCFKKSGVEWIERIPENWCVARLKNKFSFGKGLPITKENLSETGVPVISYGQIHAKFNTGTKISNELIRYVPDKYLQSHPECLVKKHDILIADTSEDLEGCGNCVYVDRNGDLFAGYHTIILRSIENRNNKYLAYLFKSNLWRSQIRTRVSGVKLFSISKKILNTTSVILPPEDEQKEIVSYLDKKCSLIDSVINEKCGLISELEIYKKSLIYEVVTGKRKVV